MEISRLMKLKVMSREMRVFVSLIVWLLSLTGAYGEIRETPSNFAVMTGTQATFRCVSNTQFPSWKAFEYDKEQNKDLMGSNCESTDPDNYSGEKRVLWTNSGGCDLTVKQHSDDLTRRYDCSDSGGTSYSAFLIVIGSLPKCSASGNDLSCTLQHSAYRNKSQLKSYMELKLEWAEPTGTPVSSKSARFSDTETVVTASLGPDATLSGTIPYHCEASFVMHCDPSDRPICSQDIFTLPGNFKCQYPALEAGAGDSDESDSEGSKSKSGSRPVIAKLERYGVEAFVMLMSLIAAFLVL